MTFFAEPAFFVLLAAAIAVAAVLGLCERPLQRWGLIVSIAFLLCLLIPSPVQAIGCAGFLVLAWAAAIWLSKNPTSNRRYYLALAATLMPLAAYKIGAVGGMAIWGFMGISYVTFKALQIVIEVHDGLIEPTELKPIDYFSFLLFFPQFTSGPIDRSRRFLADAHRVPPRDEYAELLARGILLLFAGMVYKFVIAAIAERSWAFEPWGSGPFLEEFAQQVIIAYTYGIYLFFDFAGYSFMAMGASYCLGIRCPRNFRAPFASIDIIDFWNRWHITLSTWFRDFVFMRLTRTLMRHRAWKWTHDRVHVAQAGFIVDMLVMGFWHGLTPDYIGYGLYHGVLLAANEWLQKRSAFYRAHKRKAWMRALTWFATLQLVMLGFALFSGQITFLVKGAFNG